MISLVIVTFAIACVWPNGLVVGPDFWKFFIWTALLNAFMENMSAKGMQIEKPEIFVPLAGTMPAFAVLMGWLIQGQWPTLHEKIGIAGVAFGVYLLKLGGEPMKLPFWIGAVTPEAWHPNLAYFCGPWIRVFAGGEGKKPYWLLPFVREPDDTHRSLVPWGPFQKIGFNGAQLALLIAWGGAISQNFDQVMILNGNPMLRACTVFGFVGIYWYSYSRFTGEWPRLDKSLKWEFLKLGVLRGIFDVLVSAPLLWKISASTGALKRIHILWATLFVWLFLRENQGIRQYVSKTLAILILLGGVALIGSGK